MINKGKTGRWKEHFDDETIKRFEEWEQKHLEGTGLSFTYEIWSHGREYLLDIQKAD